MQKLLYNTLYLVSSFGHGNLIMGSRSTKQAVTISCKLKETETNSFSVVHEPSIN